VPEPLSLCLGWLDTRASALVASILVPAAVYFLISALDDLCLDACWVVELWRRRRRPAPGEPVREPAIAVFVPLWREAAVIGSMVDHNLAAIAYPRCEFFIGVYPNDTETREAVAELAQRYRRVHLAEVPHEGPTSKADCLNWVYQRMLSWEELHGRHFEVVVIHDAEDLIHPLSLDRIARWSAHYDMVQVPVLALRTPWRDFTHGVYADDFAEGQSKDLPARVAAGGFLPGCGVGTAFRREALDTLAASDANRIFRPDSLTEDYDTGLRLFRLGYRQAMLPLEIGDGSALATREYFPRQADAAARQRARWMIGNVLQCWQWHGWGHGLRRPLVQAWFLWRDRKALWGSPLSLVCNMALVYGVLSYAVSVWSGRPWALREALQASPWTYPVMTANLVLLSERMAVRAWFVARIYGWSYALLVPLRVVWANWVNSRAAFGALRTWLHSRWSGEPLRWVKTEHAYPSRAALAEQRRRLGDVLVSNGWCTRENLEAALRTRRSGIPLGEHLIAMGLLGEDDLYDALRLQYNLPRADIRPTELSRRMAHTLPGEVAERWRVLPFRVADGRLDVASPTTPDADMRAAVRCFTRLDVRFHLVTPSEFAALRRHLESGAS
jgi:adsorption protein B